MKTKNGKQSVFCFPFFMKMKNEGENSNFKVKTCFNMKIHANYLNLVSRINVKAKSNLKFLNFVFQFNKNTKWYFE